MKNEGIGFIRRRARPVAAGGVGAVMGLLAGCSADVLSYSCDTLSGIAPLEVVCEVDIISGPIPENNMVRIIPDPANPDEFVDVALENYAPFPEQPDITIGYRNDAIPVTLTEPGTYDMQLRIRNLAKTIYRLLGDGPIVVDPAEE